MFSAEKAPNACQCVTESSQLPAPAHGKIRRVPKCGYSKGDIIVKLADRFRKNRNTQNKKKRGLDFHSLREEFTLLFFVLMAGMVLVINLANSFFLERFYVRNKQQALENAYKSINAAAKANEITSDAFDVELLQITSRDSIGCIIMSDESRTMKCYAQDPGTMLRRMWDNLLYDEESGQVAAPSNASSEASTEASQESAAASTGPVAEDSDTRYQVVKAMTTSTNQRLQLVLDTRTNSQSMEMWGILGDGSFYLLRTAIESITNDTRIANQFILYVGILAIIGGVFIAMALGNRISRPIRVLSDISQRMKQLDFSARYEGKDRNEIGELGENINNLSSTLEQTISELKTANNQLQRDLQKKEQVESFQREFISNVTHELKTPIALIQGYAEGLQDSVADDEESRRFYTEVIIDEANKMNQMVLKLLALTHLEFGQTDVTIEHFDVVEMIHSYLSSAGLLAKDKDVTVNVPDVPPILVWSDRFLTEEVFQNYYSNALNHVEGDKVIDIRFTKKENAVRVSVFNTGKPIPEDSIDRIWEKFYKVDKARTRAYGGSGVGLSIVKAIMDLLHQHYGVINYDNGVEFWFELDTSNREDAPKELPENREPEKSEET